MKGLFSKAIVALVVGGGGWMFLKGLHLEDIPRIFADATSNSSANQPATGQPFGGQPVVGGPATGQPWATQPGGTIKIASFNIQVFGDAKASKGYVMEELVKIVAQFDVIAIQEIRTQDDLFIQKFVNLIYQKTGRKFGFRVGPRLGNTRSTEQYAFLFDIDKVQIHPNHIYTITDPDNLLHREPMVALFAALGAPAGQDFTFVLINTHTDPDVAGDEMDSLAQVYAAVRRSAVVGGKQEDDILLLGDLNTKVPVTSSESFGLPVRTLEKRDLHALGDIPGIYPVIRSEPTNAIRKYLHDNILFHQPSTIEFRRGGVYDVAKQHGLTLDQVKMVSNHLPVWAEFSIYESGQPDRLATSPGSSVR